MFRLKIIKKGKIINFTDLPRETKLALKRVLWNTGKQILKTARSNAVQGKSGIKYKGQNFRSSSVSETSRRQSGNKIKNTNFEVTTKKLTIGTNSTVKYANAIEYGTKHIKARKDNEVATRANLTFLQDEAQKNLNLTISQSQRDYK